MSSRKSGQPAPFMLVDGRAGSDTPFRVAVVGNFPPLKCGIATFTSDLVEQLALHQADILTEVHALVDRVDEPVPPGAGATILRDDAQAYRGAAQAINAAGADAVWLQHEYGIFGGNDGELVCEFVDRIAAPLIVTLHTVLQEPSANQRRILEHLIARASLVMVMSEHSRDLLARCYGAPHEIIRVIAHGAPDRPFGRQDTFKQMLGLERRDVLMTFGLLGPGKGLERVIEALPRIAERHPQVLYRIVGATHPNLVAREGEAYRERLQSLARTLGVERHVEWEDRFLDTDDLLGQIEACDIYLTPYFNLQQSTSGTLSYAVALGKAVISSPYVHARELLADGVGVLIEPDSADAIADAVIALLDDRERLAAIQRCAYDKGRTTIWPRFAARTAALVREAAAAPRTAPGALRAPAAHGFLAMCDDTGMLQHAIGIVPDREHGYCLDDNARALMLAARIETMDEAQRHILATRFAAFVQAAWNEEARGFRNFMRFDRQWSEELGSEDSNGRAIWALGYCAAHIADEGLRQWAAHWYTRTMPHMLDLGSPRAVAFTMLGAAAYLRVDPAHGLSHKCLREGADLLKRLFDAGRRPDWAWFEAVLGYDNPRLCQALLEASEALDDPAARSVGLETLRWICAQQTSANGQFRPIGSDSFGAEFESMPFDQQPLEAQAAIEAAALAHALTGEPLWREHAERAWLWFFGVNDRGAVLADPLTGRCRDGVTPRGANENCGAESILAYQFSYLSMLGAFARPAYPVRAQDRQTGAGDHVAVSRVT